MSSAGVVSSSETQAKSPRKRAKPRQKKTCPALSALILNAVSAERGSVSLQALKKALQGAGYDVTKNNARILTCIRRLVGNKCLLQTKGTGALGSFKKAPTPQKKVVKKKAKKVKKATTKKETAGVTPVAKKSPKKKKKAKSPKKVKKATPTKAKKAKSPKKPKRVVQSTRNRK